MCVCLSWVFSLHMGSLSSYFLLCILSSLGLKEVSVLFWTLCLLFPYFTSPFYSLRNCSSLLLTILLLLLLPGFHTSLCWVTCWCFYVCLIFLFVGPNWKRALNLIWAFTPTMWPVIVVLKCYHDWGRDVLRRQAKRRWDRVWDVSEENLRENQVVHRSTALERRESNVFWFSSYRCQINAHS